MTDGKGKKVSCKDAVFVMTANVANEEISQHALELRETARDISKHKQESASTPKQNSTSKINIKSYIRSAASVWSCVHHNISANNTACVTLLYI